MRINLIGYWTAIAAVLVGSVTDGMAGGGSFTRGCAARDMQVLMMIEQGEDSNAISLQRLTEAVQTMMHARMICFEGRVPDALAIYDEIANSLTSEQVLSGRIR